MTTETIHAGGGIYIDVIQPKKSARKPRKKSTKNKDDAVLAELTPEQAKALNEALTAKVPEVDVEVLEPDVLPCPASAVIVEEQLADGTVVSEGPLTLPIVPTTRSINPHHPISALPPGSNFMSNGIVGTLVEMVGMDAKVELDGGGVQYWSGASMVYWLPCKPRIKSAKPARSEAPTSTSAKTPNRPTTVPASKPASSKKLIEGFSPCRIVMWMGARGMSFDQAKRVIVHHGATIGDGTIRANLKSAGTGKLGKPAELTQAQVEAILSVAG